MKKLINLILFTILMIKFAYALKECDRTHSWTLSGKKFPKDFKTSVKLVALLKASCSFCRVQAARLADLRDELVRENVTNVSFIIVNAHDHESVKKAPIFKTLTTVPIVQDIERINVWNRYKGLTDDMLIFDKCNRLVKQVSLPESVVTDGFVKKEILKAYYNSPCGNSCKFRP